MFIVENLEIQTPSFPKKALSHNFIIRDHLYQSISISSYSLLYDTFYFILVHPNLFYFTLCMKACVEIPLCHALFYMLYKYLFSNSHNNLMK